ncbi:MULTISPECIES: iron-containing alcohol dehydrogenase family protein [Anoxybacillus]|uniref:Glycerol-1-phosphate dehydrogenase [NAD(P)+] n=1 Tax=Anoxybacillus ayderensis TaxID=265546 RepID=A0A0D0GBX4_9BACL|nr:MULTISPECIES: iron-containing alcohol dehydrogenase family protein [Anoxybacillus]KIP22720.1 Glycerol-1-phosphate dehydrogenase [NAD(P)+] [Anoxybacillus ayderensis]MBA2877897.1 glycerol-1-phosphate dehydrogenase [NAD(P)+] [Anoxybacillus ayderensis]NNU96767.1 iron-containing alcohol dehydrogenase [Anoxybacillus sp. EFIL]
MNIPIPSILEIGEGVICRIDELMKTYRFSKAVILFDDFTYQTYEKEMKRAISSAAVHTVCLPPQLDIVDIMKKAFELPHCDVMMAMGGGAVIDCGKYMAFLRQVPFLSIPTSASNDGFASTNCSLLVNGKKTTVPAKVPFGILADLRIVQQAPDRFILAGVGDLMSNITALYDWEFEQNHGVSRVNAFAAMISKKAVNSFIRTPMQNIKHPIFLKELISSLTMGGISTVISGNSAPISGSEHLISHALDQISESPHMHGIQVGIATYIMAHVQQHRAERITKVFTRTGFFDYVKTLRLNKKEYREAINIAPTIKPNRYTYIHDEQYRKRAIQLLDEDPILQEIFV